MIQGKERFVSLDGLRGIFSILVLCYHFSADIKYDPMQLTDNLVFRNSFFFVDFFFVLSGFVIGYNYFNFLSSKNDLRKYLIKRFVRLYPMLFYSVCVFVPLKIYGVVTGYQFNDGEYSYTDIVLETLDSITFMNSTPILGNDAGMNPPSWSISAEMIAYILFGLIILNSSKKRIVFISLLILGLFVFFLNYGSLKVTGSFGFLRGTLGFFLGVLISRVDLKKNKFLSYLEIPYLTILIVLFGFYDSATMPLTSLVMPIWFCIGIFIFTKSNGIISKFLVLDTIQFLGKISYSIYLNHFFILWIVYFIWWRLAKFEVNALAIYSNLLIVLLLTIAYSFFTHKYVEKKGGVWLKNRLS